MFDKSKAMRGAERYLSQGKIRNAIAEYCKVIENDPRDVVTLNLLGDLYAKNSENVAAINCYRKVADHYSQQGFAQKAIAVYNKISRIDPGSLEVSQKLAELYKVKGSLKEAKSHYSTLAEHYNQQGRRIEALEIWTEIASLDPNNTEVYLTIAEAYLQEERLDDAADAYANAGKRLLLHSRHEEALDSFSKAFAIDAKQEGALSGLIDTKFAMGCGREAIEHIERLLEDDPHSRELLSALIDALMRDGDAAAAERSLVKLIEKDPTCYMKSLELSELYLEQNDTDSAVRLLSIASEHMLVGGQAGELHRRLDAIDAAEPDRLDVVRLLARFCSWQKDDEYLRTTLVRLADISAREDSKVDERYALSQLVVSMPQEARYLERLTELNAELGIEDDLMSNNMFDEKFVKTWPVKADEVTPALEYSNGESAATLELAEANGAADFAIVAPETASAEQNGDESSARKKKGKRGKKAEEPAVEVVASPEPVAEAAPEPVLENAHVPDDSLLANELDSIRFYIENGYNDLAGKALEELKRTYGEREEIEDMFKMLRSGDAVESPAPSAATPAHTVQNNSGAFDLADFRSELGIDDPDTSENSDFETLFQTAVAYQEMGLTEQAIKEFQDAAALVQANDGTRRFFICANLLGHCFMNVDKPNLAVKWHLRSLESFDISDEERLGVWYELGVSYEANGELDNAFKYFEQVYAENIDFRDIAERMKNAAVMA